MAAENDAFSMIMQFEVDLALYHEQLRQAERIATQQADQIEREFRAALASASSAIPEEIGSQAERASGRFKTAWANSMHSFRKDSMAALGVFALFEVGARALTATIEQIPNIGKAFSGNQEEAQQAIADIGGAIESLPLAGTMYKLGQSIQNAFTGAKNEIAELEASVKALDRQAEDMGKRIAFSRGATAQREEAEFEVRMLLLPPDRAAMARAERELEALEREFAEARAKAGTAVLDRSLQLQDEAFNARKRLIEVRLQQELDAVEAAENEIASAEQAANAERISGLWSLYAEYEAKAAEAQGRSLDAELIRIRESYRRRIETADAEGRAYLMAIQKLDEEAAIRKDRDTTATKGDRERQMQSRQEAEARDAAGRLRALESEIRQKELEAMGKHLEAQEEALRESYRRRIETATEAEKALLQQALSLDLASLGRQGVASGDLTESINTAAGTFRIASAVGAKNETERVANESKDQLISLVTQSRDQTRLLDRITVAVEGAEGVLI